MLALAAITCGGIGALYLLHPAYQGYSIAAYSLLGVSGAFLASTAALSVATCLRKKPEPSLPEPSLPGIEEEISKGDLQPPESLSPANLIVTDSNSMAMYFNTDTTTEAVHVFSFRNDYHENDTRLHAKVGNQAYVFTTTFERVSFTQEGIRSLVIHFYNIFIQVKEHLQAKTCTFHFDVEAEGAYRALALSVVGSNPIYRDMNSSLMASILLMAAKYAGVDLTLHIGRHHLDAQLIRENTTLEENETLDDWCTSILPKQTTTKDSESESESGSYSGSYTGSGSYSGSYSGSGNASADDALHQGGNDRSPSASLETHHGHTDSDGEESEIESN